MASDPTTPPLTTHHSPLTTPPPELPGFANVYENTGEAELPADEDPRAEFDRRQFLALSAAFGLAAATGCRRPDIEILPFSESHDGRPTKVEGNPKHPCSLGSTDVYAQAAVYDLYSPDRVLSEKYPGVMEKGLARTWADFDRFARAEADRLTKEQGKGFFVLAEDLASPSVRLVRRHMKAKLPQASWHVYEPIDTTEARLGAGQAFGARLAVRYRFEKADRILALDSDFLGLDPDQVAYSRAFAERRKAQPMNRLYAVESTYSVTGTAADHRLRLASAQVGNFLVAV